MHLAPRGAEGAAEAVEARAAVASRHSSFHIGDAIIIDGGYNLLSHNLLWRPHPFVRYAGFLWVERPVLLSSILKAA